MEDILQLPDKAPGLFQKKCEIDFYSAMVACSRKDCNYALQDFDGKISFI
jgi:hypothetical protein